MAWPISPQEWGLVHKYGAWAALDWRWIKLNFVHCDSLEDVLGSVTSHRVTVSATT